MAVNSLMLSSENCSSSVLWNLSKCEIATQLAISPIAKLSLALLLVFSMLSLFFNAVLMRGLFRTVTVQRNTQVLLVSISIAAIIRSSGSLVEFSLHFARLYSDFGLPHSKANCLWENFPSILASYSLSLSVIGVAWERAIATKNFRTYEQHPQFPSRTFVGAAWIFPATVGIAGRLSTTGDYVYPICRSALIYEGSLLISFSAINTAIGVISLIIFLVVYCANITRLRSYLYNQAQLSLSGRFQLTNNLEMTKTLFPSIVLHAVIYFSADITYIYVAYVGEETFHSAVDILILLAYINVLIMLFAAFHPISLLLINPKLRSHSLLDFKFPRRLYAIGPLPGGRRKSLILQRLNHARTVIPLRTLTVDKSFENQLEISASQHPNSIVNSDENHQIMIGP